MKWINARRGHTQMVAVPRERYVFDKKRIKQSMGNVRNAININIAVFFEIMRMPQPTLGLVSGIFNGDMRKNFGKQFTRNAHAVIIELGHLIKANPFNNLARLGNVFSAHFRAVLIIPQNFRFMVTEMGGVYR